MAVTRDTLAQAAGLRVATDGVVDSATADLATAWNRAWQVVVSEWQAAAEALVAAAVDGRTPGLGVVMRDERAQRALAATRALLSDLSEQAGVKIVDAAGQTVQIAADGRPGLVSSQVPAAHRADIAATFNRVSEGQIDEIVRRSTQQIESTLRALSADATEAMLDSLVRGVIVGDDPNTAARRMVDAVRGEFDGGLTRATVIARTEMLDAHRAAGGKWDAANTQTIQGWQWLASLDKRTCPSCWSQHGSVHAADDPGPQDHQQGRCARIPVARPWSDLGIDLPEPPSVLPDARATFDALPRADQLEIMGAKRLELLDSGALSWAQLSQRRVTSGWRDSYAPTPLSDLK